MTKADHRSRVAAEKRERMRAHLIERAIGVFADKGLDAVVIDDVIAAAEVSRGTFYNYFKTNDELMGAVQEVLGNELTALVDAEVLERTDPAERLACGVRITLHTALQHPLLARFASRVSLDQTLRNNQVMNHLLRDIQAGVESGQFSVPSTELGMVLALGSTLAAIYSTTLLPDLSSNFAEDVTYHLLLGLGMTKAQARKLVDKPVGAVIFPENSLLARTRKMPGQESAK